MVPLKDTHTVYGDISAHDVESPTADETWSFPWNTNQRDSANEPELFDGLRTVTIIAYDDRERASVPMRRTYLIDNYAPQNAPATSVTNARSVGPLAQMLGLSWNPVLDGTSPADHYAYELYEKQSDSETISDWDPVAVSAGMTAPALPLAVYAARVQAHSVLDKIGPWGTSARLLTSPELNGTHDVARAKYNGSNDTGRSRPILDPQPHGPTALECVMERTGGGAAGSSTDITAAVTEKWNANQPYAFSETLAQTIKRNVDPVPPEYRLKVIITPSGETAQTSYSNYAKCTIPAISNTSPPATNLAYAVRW
jgi:hypothetical protein